jgi:hydrogenase small subunit
MDEDPFGGAAATVMKLSYGPVVRYFRKRHIAKKFDTEPEWRHNRPTLTTGYAKRW